jgi:elongation factor P
MLVYMVAASQLQDGMVVRFEGVPCAVWQCEHVRGHGHGDGMVIAQLLNLLTGKSRRQKIAPALSLEEVFVQKQAFSYLYDDGNDCRFMNDETFEQISLPERLIGERKAFLHEGMSLEVCFVDGQPYRVAFNKVVDATVSFTFPPDHYSSSYKRATLDNGVQVKVPLSVSSGSKIRLYIDLLQAV